MYFQHPYTTGVNTCIKPNTDPNTIQKDTRNGNNHSNYYPTAKRPMDSVSRPLARSTTGSPIPGSNRGELSAKDKRYYQQVERALASFDSLEEWADYIAFLSRLQKSLQLNEGAASFVPFAGQVAHKLALCLAAKLPNGVHQKTLSLYDSIFSAVSSETLDSQISLWLPGILPLFSYCSIQIKPILIQIFQHHILTKVSAKTLQQVTKPLILSFLPGLDDENSETFTEFMLLMDTLKKKTANDNHFWQSFFLCVISNPEKRLGALFWCNRRLPLFSSIKTETSSGATPLFSEEAQACISPEPGLLIRAFATSISSTTSMVSANDIIVVRGFFDLLLTHLPLDCEVLTQVASERDRELLMSSCCSITLKKDMSLNRRLWNWLLGPDTEVSINETKKTGDSERLTRSEYLQNYGLETLSTILLNSINDRQVSKEKRVNAFKISLFLIMDKWEISHLVTPSIFLPIMRATYHSSGEGRDSNDILLAAQSFFDSVEAAYIWSDLNSLIMNNKSKDLDLVEFVVNNFDLNEEEMLTVHIPLAITVLLTNTKEVGPSWILILDTLSRLVSPRAFNVTNEVIKENDSFSVPNDINQVIKHYYSTLIENSDKTSVDLFPWNTSKLTFITVTLLKSLVVDNISNHDKQKSTKLCDLLCQLSLVISTNESNTNWVGDDLIEVMTSQSISTPEDDEFQQQQNLLTTFNLTKLLNSMEKSLTPIVKDKMLRIIISNLFVALTSSYPANYQVESVKCIFDLDRSFSTYQIEAGLVKLFSQASSIEIVRAISILWTHSNQFTDSDAFISRPLQLVLDNLFEEEEESYAETANFIGNILKGGSANRLLKLLTNPLLEFEFVNYEITALTSEDDLGQFAYYLSSIVNVIKTDVKHWKESFNNELAVMDNTNKLKVVNSNSWDISSYKSLLIHIIKKFLKLKVDKSILDHDTSDSLNNYYKCITKSLEILSMLVSGNEIDFPDNFNLLLEAGSQFKSLNSNTPRAIELVEIKYLKCIKHFLKISQDLKINLNLLHIEDEAKDPPLIGFIVKGIERAQSTVLLESWTSLLTKSTYLFNEAIFSVLLTLSDSLVTKINSIFKKISNQGKFTNLTDAEASINVLMSGLEDLLCISHGYLLSSNMRARNESNGNANESGFFGNVIQGVFSIESPSIRTTEENKRYSILLAFHDAVRTSFSIWLWADSKPVLETKDDSFQFASEKSLAYLSRKLKFKARKHLESLVELERQEVIETLISFGHDSKATTKLLHVLDGGRSQVTLPNILNSILTRCYPQGLDDKNKSSMNTDVSAKELAKFLAAYMESVDDDTVSDIWNFTVSFFKDVNAHPANFKSIFPELLKTITILSLKLSATKFGEQGRHKKDLGDIFSKLLILSLNSKISGNIITDNEIDEKDNSLQMPQEEIPVERAFATQGELLGTLTIILERLDDMVGDDDKVSSCINTIIGNLVSPQIRSSKINEIPIQTISLISLIGNKHPNKIWKSAVQDCFFDNSFFLASFDKIKQWENIIQKWITVDKDRILELISKVTSGSTSSTSNIFNWNENSESDNKVCNLKRISFLIQVQPKDYFLNPLQELFDRLDMSLGSACPATFKAEILILLRVITLKFSELHLLPHWTMISQEIRSVFEFIEQKNNKELTSLTKQELRLILQSCKLLDQLLLLKYDEFNLSEWLFVSSSPDLVVDGVKPSAISLVDKIATEKDLSFSKEPAVRIEHPGGDSKPLLEGVSEIKSLAALRLFFSSLSLLHYERTYGLDKINYSACQDDILRDIVAHIGK
ncbi:protein dopey [[Candida] anglica]|uniref:Protein dopey n=1 Tax=[Candida] anglica TaxID=148631 RepID=A0ABP0EDH4_9ASCO